MDVVICIVKLNRSNHIGPIDLDLKQLVQFNFHCRQLPLSNLIQKMYASFFIFIIVLIKNNCMIIVFFSFLLSLIHHVFITKYLMRFFSLLFLLLEKLQEVIKNPMVSFLEHLARGRLMNFLYNINFHNKRLRFEVSDVEKRRGSSFNPLPPSPVSSALSLPFPKFWVADRH